MEMDLTMKQAESTMGHFYGLHEGGDDKRNNIF